MRALLNSLGLTLWSSIAIVLAVGLALVGYRVSLKDEHAAIGHPATSTAPGPPAALPPLNLSLGETTPAVREQRYSRVIEPEMMRAEAALQSAQWQEVLDDAQAAERKQGITVFDTKRINHFKAYAHLQLHDYNAALTDFERVLASGNASPEETATISKTVAELRAHSESERDIPARQEGESPRQEIESAQRESEAPQQREPYDSVGGDKDVKLGEVYYGFGDYQSTVDAITRGLRKRPSAHLDEAYVYLGLAQQKLNNIAEARRAFARLKDVPNISPRILRLWTLYADTLVAPPRTADSSAGSQELSVSKPSPTPLWTEGRNYRLIPQPVPTSLPRGKVLVTELFSYACPACNQLQSHMRMLIKSLPQNAVLSYVPVSFQPQSTWPMLQLAYETAQTLGVANDTHDAMFEAVWSGGELSPTDVQTGLPRSPTIEDVAEFYRKRAGVPVTTFLRASSSFTVDAQVRRDDNLIKAYGIDRVPTIVVDGKYATDVQSAGSAQRLIDLVVWLVAKEAPPPEQANLRRSQPERD